MNLRQQKVTKTTLVCPDGTELATIMRNLKDYCGTHNNLVTGTDTCESCMHNDVEGRVCLYSIHNKAPGDWTNAFIEDFCNRLNRFVEETR